MLSYLPSFIIGIITLLVLTLNTIISSLPLFLVAALKLIIPMTAFRESMGKIANNIAEFWSSINTTWIQLIQKPNLQVEGLEHLNRNNCYLVIANHQSCVDIIIMQLLLNKRIPLMKFFLKKELIWIPIIGLCWWALDFPFMQRYSKSYLSKHPEKKNADFAATIKACKKLQDTPVSIVNYLEGTRFSKEKHSQQKSFFKYLLKPKAGGAGYALSAMRGRIQRIINITIQYHQPNIGFWDFLCCRIKNVSLHIEVLMIPHEFTDKDYQSDPAFRQQFQQWINSLWIEKDRRLHHMINSHRKLPQSTNKK